MNNKDILRILVRTFFFFLTYEWGCRDSHSRWGRVGDCRLQKGHVGWKEQLTATVFTEENRQEDPSCATFIKGWRHVMKHGVDLEGQQQPGQRKLTIMMHRNTKAIKKTQVIYDWKKCETIKEADNCSSHLRLRCDKTYVLFEKQKQILTCRANKKSQISVAESTTGLVYLWKKWIMRMQTSGNFGALIMWSYKYSGTWFSNQLTWYTELPFLSASCCNILHLYLNLLVTKFIIELKILIYFPRGQSKVPSLRIQLCHILRTIW